MTHLLAMTLAAAASSSKAKATSGSANYSSLIFLVLIALAAWLLFFRPRSRQAQQQRQVLNTLSAGDEVLTGAGIYGTVLDVYPDRVTIETAPGTRMTVARSTIARKIDPTDAAAPPLPHEDDEAPSGGWDEDDDEAWGEAGEHTDDEVEYGLDDQALDDSSVDGQFDEDDLEADDLDGDDLGDGQLDEGGLDDEALDDGHADGQFRAAHLGDSQFDDEADVVGEDADEGGASPAPPSRGRAGRRRSR